MKIILFLSRLNCLGIVSNLRSFLHDQYIVQACFSYTDSEERWLLLFAYESMEVYENTRNGYTNKY